MSSRLVREFTMAVTGFSSVASAAASSVRVARIGALAATLTGACHPAPGPRSADAVTADQITAPADVAPYLPLEDGTVFSYDTTSRSAGRGTLIVQISRPRPGRVDLRMGSKTERLEITPEGVAYVQGGFLLKTPLSASASWKSKTGTTRVEHLDLPVDVPAGHFEGCVSTLEETREPGIQRSVRTVFCPHVGLVSLAVEAVTDDGQEQETAVLKAFGPRVDVAKGESTTTTTAAAPQQDP